MRCGYFTAASSITPPFDDRRGAELIVRKLVKRRDSDMLGQRGFWDVEDRLKGLSAEGDPLETSRGDRIANRYIL